MLAFCSQITTADEPINKMSNIIEKLKSLTMVCKGFEYVGLPNIVPKITALSVKIRFMLDHRSSQSVLTTDS